MVGQEYAAVLREAAEFFEAHPDLPLPETARILTFYYEDLTAIELSWLTEIAIKEGFKAEPSPSGLNLWVRRLGRGSLAFVFTSSTSKPSRRIGLVQDISTADTAVTYAAFKGARWSR